MRTCGQAELQRFVHGRLERYQKAAESWLAILTTLLGLFGAVVVLNGGKAISDLHGGVDWHVAVFVIAATVFALAFAAIFEGLHATWTGLSGGGLTTRREGWRGVLLDQWWPQRIDVEHLELWKFHNYMQNRPDDVRKRLHRSRILGTLSAAMAGVLALVIVYNSAFIKAATPVIVVEHGHVLCGPIHVGPDGLSRIGGHVITGATQVMMGSC